MAVQSNLKNMALCLLAVGLVCSGLLAGVYALTCEPIARAAEKKTAEAIARVVPEGFTSVSPRQSVTVDGREVGYCTVQRDSVLTAYVFFASATGFGGPLQLMVGITPDGTLFDTFVLAHAETPGLGAKCVEEGFRGQFRGFDPFRSRLSVRKDGGDVDAITASTITSRAYVGAIAQARDAFRQLVPAAAESGEDNLETAPEAQNPEEK